MLVRMMGAGSTMAGLRSGLTESARSVRSIAHDVANASTPRPAGAPGPAAPGPAFEAAGLSEAELEERMVRMADEQLRFEAAANLLQKVHQQFRASVRER